MLQQTPFRHHDGFAMGWHWGWGLFWLIVVVLAIWALTRALTSSGSDRGRTCGDEVGSSEDAESVLKRRYAAGELSEEEFRERLSVLRESE